MYPPHQALQSHFPIFIGYLLGINVGPPIRIIVMYVDIWIMSVSAPSRWTEFKNRLPAGGSATGNRHSVSTQTYFGVLIYTDVEGVVQIEQSANRNDWYVTDQAFVKKQEPTRLVGELVLEYARFHCDMHSQAPSTFKAYTIAKETR